MPRDCSGEVCFRISLFNCLLEAHFSQAHEDEEMVRKFFVLLSLVGLR